MPRSAVLIVHIMCQNHPDKLPTMFPQWPNVGSCTVIKIQGRATVAPVACQNNAVIENCPSASIMLAL